METKTNHLEDGGKDPHHDSKDRKRFFVVIFLLLCALTLTSFWIANSHLMETRAVGWTAMMAVAVAKALLVILFFMHLWWERRWKYVLTLPALVLGLVLVLLLVPDVGLRTDTWSNTRRNAAPMSIDTSSSASSDPQINFP